jgi:ribosomal-protein-alanine N-acetyltransferase
MNLPATFNQLQGGKVVLCAFTEADITPAYLGWLNDLRVTRFSNQRLRHHNATSSLAFLASFSGTDNFFINVRSRLDGRAIGTMTAYVNRFHETADVGLLLGDLSKWGKGYGQDAWNTLGAWLLGPVGTRKLTAGAAAGNIAMIRIMETFGMHYEATRFGQELIEEKPHDLLYYAKFNK